MAGTPLATAFVAVRADTSRVKGDVESGLGGVDAEGQGKKVGAGFVSGLKAAAAGAAIAGIFTFGKDSIDSYKEAEAAQSRLSDAFAKFPALADTNKEALQDLNSELMSKTRFDDDALASGQAVLAQFGLTGSQLQQLTPLLADYAAKTGADAPTAAEQLGKALLGQGRALKSVGIDFKDAGSVGANFDQIMAGLRTQVGGFAEQEGQTAAGKAQILANQFGEIQEKVGGALVPALQALADKLLEVIGFIQENSDVIGPLAAVVGALGLAIGAASVATSIWSGLQTVATVASGIWTAAQWALNAALSANPIGLVVIAIAALVAAFVWAWNNSETFRNVVTGAWNAIKGAAEAVGNWFTGTLVPALSGAWSALQSGFETVGSVIRGVWGGLKEAAAVPIRFVVNTVFGGVVQKFNDVVGFLHLDSLKLAVPHVDFDSGGYTGPGGKHDPAGVVHAGEYVINAASTRKIMSEAPGLLAGLNGYEDGGLVGRIGGWISSAVSGIWDFIRDPAGTFTRVVDGLMGAVGSTPIGQMGIGLVRSLVGGLVDKVKGMFAGSTAGTGEVVSPGRVSVGGKLLDSDTYARIVQALGSGWQLFQGSWSTSVAASAGTHAGAGVADLAPTAGGWDWAVAMLRAAGLDAWFRNWTGNQHIHLVNPHVSGLSAEALSQVVSFNRGGSGLAAGYMRGGLVIPTFDRGGTLAPGLNLVNNGTGAPESLTPTNGQRLYLVLEDGTEMRAYIDARVARPAQMAAAGRRTV